MCSLAHCRVLGERHRLLRLAAARQTPTLGAAPACKAGRSAGQRQRNAAVVGVLASSSLRALSTVCCVLRFGTRHCALLSPGCAFLHSCDRSVRLPSPPDHPLRSRPLGRRSWKRVEAPQRRPSEPMLSASDFQASQRRLEQRGKEVAERARQKADKERLLAERAAARQAAREEEARQRRLAQLAAEEEVRGGRGQAAAAGWSTHEAAVAAAACCTRRAQAWPPRRRPPALPAAPLRAAGAAAACSGAGGKPRRVLQG